MRQYAAASAVFRKRSGTADCWRELRSAAGRPETELRSARGGNRSNSDAGTMAFRVPSRPNWEAGRPSMGPNTAPACSLMRRIASSTPRTVELSRFVPRGLPRVGSPRPLATETTLFGESIITTPALDSCHRGRFLSWPSCTCTGHALGRLPGDAVRVLVLAPHCPAPHLDALRASRIQRRGAIPPVVHTRSAPGSSATQRAVTPTPSRSDGRGSAPAAGRSGPPCDEAGATGGLLVLRGRPLSLEPARRRCSGACDHHTRGAARGKVGRPSSWSQRSAHERTGAPCHGHRRTRREGVTNSSDLPRRANVTGHASIWSRHPTSSLNPSRMARSRSLEASRAVGMQFGEHGTWKTGSR